jgi:predicted metal-binding membrane protein
MLADRIRAMGAPHWVGLYAAILAAWAVLWAMAAAASDLAALSGAYGAALWETLCAPAADAAGIARLWAMWALMGAAMMTPTALPAFATYEDLGRATRTRFGALAGGYLAVWAGFAAAAALVQTALWQSGLLDPLGASTSVALSAALLALAGLYQFSALKHACLSKCRAPLTFFMQHWDEGPWRMGLRLGAVCLGCCWALMALAFVGGTMNLGFMAAGMVLMAVEKLSLGRALTRPLGIALLAAAALVAAGAL